MKKILIIDDEEDIRIVLKEVLEREGFAVQTASGSDEGLDMLRKNGADLVVTDIIMPGKDGVQAINEIQTDFPGTKIIVISGGGNVAPLDYQPTAIKTSAYLASANAAGADLTLSKPFDRKELVRAIVELTAE